MSNRPSMTISGDGEVAFTDSYGCTHSTTGIDIQPGDVVSARIAEDGVWCVVERDGEERRHPLRMAACPHFTELQAMPIPFNPLWPEGTA
ncbi:hypothetical protein ACQP1O_43035 (plasmid) [Nocardia sp. CA-151230]|uniref:hypothetical protein n=1 Tax=Nocardia sp. CA-151230 TaxID=3239982 RepID=UPI003D915DD1